MKLETKEKIRQSLKGRKLSNETKIKMSIVRSGKKLPLHQVEIIRKRMIGNTIMLGKHHANETKEKIRQSNIGLKRNEQTKINISKNKRKYYLENPNIIFERQHKYCFYRKDLGHLCRTKFEANYCRFLNCLNIEYEYEKKRFKLSDGSVYICDLYLPEFDSYIELKGWPFTEETKRKYEIFKMDYPSLSWKLLLQKSEEWNSIKRRYSRIIPGWEE